MAWRSAVLRVTAQCTLYYGIGLLDLWGFLLVAVLPGQQDVAFHLKDDFGARGLQVNLQALADESSKIRRFHGGFHPAVFSGFELFL